MNSHQPPGRALGSDLLQVAAEGEEEQRLEEEEVAGVGVGQVTAPQLMKEELPPGGQDGWKGEGLLGLNQPGLQLPGETH